MYQRPPTQSSDLVKLSPRAALSMRRGDAGTYQQVTILQVKVKESFNRDRGRGLEKLPLCARLLALSQEGGSHRCIALTFPHLLTLSERFLHHSPLSERSPNGKMHLHL